PAAGSMRPGVFDSPHVVKFNASQIDMTKFRSDLEPASGAPTRGEVEWMLPPAPWMEWSGNWVGQQIGPAPETNRYGAGRNGVTYDNYGRTIGIKWGVVGLWLNLAIPNSDKQLAAIRTVQAGIDIASYIK